MRPRQRALAHETPRARTESHDGLLDSDTERRLAERARNGDVAARDRLIVAHFPLVAGIARSLSGYPARHEERTDAMTRRMRGGGVLVATDLSEASDEALLQAHERAHALGAHLAVVHVIPLRALHLHAHLLPADQLEDAPWRASALEALQAYVAERTGRARENFEAIVETGPPHAAIVRTAERIGVSLVVVGSQGTTGLSRILLGSVAEQVVRLAHCPVLVARARRKTGQILAATDFSDPALPALEAAALAARTAGRLTVMHCVDLDPPPSARVGIAFGGILPLVSDEVRTEVVRLARVQLEAAVASVGAQATCRVAEGSAAATIVRLAEDLPADLVVVGTAGRTGMARVLLGSVAESVVRHAPCSVLAVRLTREAHGRPSRS